MIKPEGKGLAMDQHVEACPRDCRSRGMAIGSIPRYRSMRRIYQQVRARLNSISIYKPIS
jgi:hypothetical protein